MTLNEVLSVTQLFEFLPTRRNSNRIGADSEKWEKIDRISNVVRGYRGLNRSFAMLVPLTRLITRKGRVVLNRKYVKHGEEWRWRDATTMSSAGRLPGDVVESRVCWRSLAESLQSSIEKRANPRWKSNAWNEEKKKRRRDDFINIASNVSFSFSSSSIFPLTSSVSICRWCTCAKALSPSPSLSLSVSLLSLFVFPSCNPHFSIACVHSEEIYGLFTESLVSSFS